MSHPHASPQEDLIPRWKSLGYDSPLAMAEDEITNDGPAHFVEIFGSDELCELLYEHLPVEQYAPVKELMIQRLESHYAGDG